MDLETVIAGSAIELIDVISRVVKLERVLRDIDGDATVLFDAKLKSAESWEAFAECVSGMVRALSDEQLNRNFDETVKGMLTESDN